MSGRVIIVGAGIGGLAAAVELSAQGRPVLVLERQAAPGGKLRQEGPAIDAGPTVFTMRWVFEEIFARAGTSLDAELTLRRARVLARHGWDSSGGGNGLHVDGAAGARLDLFADVAESADAIGRFAGAAEAAGFLAFCRRAKEIYETLERPFLRAALPTPFSLASNAGLSGMKRLVRISPFDTLMRMLEKYFQDARLRQLFGRYATYCGSSPFLAPATLMLVAHVEQDGVWLPAAGMYGLVQALARVLARLGGTVRCGAEVVQIAISGGRARGVTLASGEFLEADSVVVNADPSAIGLGFFGAAAARAAPAAAPAARSQSAITWTMVARVAAEGFPLTRHNVFFSNDYAAEFDAVFARGQVPEDPTVYVCAQDRAEDETAGETERLLVLINAPADGDRKTYDEAEVSECMTRVTRRLGACGLRLMPEQVSVTTPSAFAQRFPGTGGALYGQAVHGPMATFRRPGAVTRIPGLFLAGGATHPGAGVPMAALSGIQAAAAVLRAGVSTRR